MFFTVIMHNFFRHRQNKGGEKLTCVIFGLNLPQESSSENQIMFDLVKN